MNKFVMYPGFHNHIIYVVCDVIDDVRTTTRRLIAGLWYLGFWILTLYGDRIDETRNHDDAILY